MKWHSPILIPFLTLKCHFACTYCITKYAPDYNHTFDHLDTSSWITFLNSTKPITDIVFNGGEPTLYPYFHDIINSLKPLTLLAIGTNYSHQSLISLLKITPRPDLILDGSFHPHHISLDNITSNLLKLKDKGFRIRVHVLNYPGFSPAVPKSIAHFHKHGIPAFTQPYEGFWEGQFVRDPSKAKPCGLKDRSTVSCSRSIYTPIAPDGTIYFCHYLMYSQIRDGVLGHISDSQTAFPTNPVCHHYGFCSPCDWPRQVKFK